MRKVIFADIDGVLNSYRSITAFNSYPKNCVDTEGFDMVAVGLIRTACKKCNAEIILSSTWRLDKDWESLKNTLDLPIVDRTPNITPSSRGEEIAMWLRDNVVFEYVILDDDDTNILETQKNNFVHVLPFNGLSFNNYTKILGILGDETKMSKPTK